MATNDDNDVHVSLNEIEKGLWLGNASAATDLDTLKKHDITFILSIDSCPLPLYIQQITALTTKYIQISDITQEDLLSHFDECITFIDAALSNKNRILVHCYFGVSRSAAVVIAYIMKKYKISYAKAFERVKSKRRFIGPNPGFIKQLGLFYKMGWKIDPQNEHYKHYRLRLAASKVRKAQILPNEFMNLIKSDPNLIQENPEPIVYRCKNCRRIIVTKSNFITHKRRQINNSLDTSMNKLQIYDKNNDYNYDINNLEAIDGCGTGNVDDVGNGCGGSVDKSGQSVSCGSDGGCSGLIDDYEVCKEIYFIEPLAWMEGITKNVQGKLHCPKCRHKLGNFSWINGCNCPCGKLISPAFYLVPSKVELSHSVQNVQITI